MLRLFLKEKLIIKKDKIVNTHKYMLFSTKHDEIPKTAIEAIDITENPASGRYFVSVISDEKSITFGAKFQTKNQLPSEQSFRLKICAGLKNFLFTRL